MGAIQQRKYVSAEFYILLAPQLTITIVTGGHKA